MRTLHTLAFLIVVTLGPAACDSSRSPTVPSPTAPSLTAPSPQPQPPPAVPAPTVGLVLASGAVADTGFRSLPGAKVEVVDGPDAGMSVIADAAGRFTLTGRFDNSTQFRATRDHRVTLTKR